MKKIKIETSDFDGTTAKVTTPSNVFYVQTVDGEYRQDLGCLITTETDSIGVDYDDYQDEDFKEIIKLVEGHMEDLLPEGLTENPNYINKQTSSYKRRFLD